MTQVLRTDVLVEEAQKRGLIDRSTAIRIGREAREGRGQQLELLVAELRGGTAVLKKLAEDTRIPFVDVNSGDPPRSLIDKAPELIRRKRVLPLRREGSSILVATAAPEDVQTLDALERALGSPITVALADPGALDAAIERALGAGARNSTVRIRPPELEPITVDAVGILDELLREAVNRRASDVHIEPLQNEVRIRFRVDGALQVKRPALRVEVGNPLISRVKILSGLDIAEKREPQDGGFSWSAPNGRQLDFRVATAPCRHGERATIRVLGLETESLTLASLGLDAGRLQQMKAVIARPHGMVLLTGPTGSGKTTTLYAVLRELNVPDVNIITVEDPIEYAISGVNQVQVDHVGKVSFANVLRSLLRHDPDVLMVGEIRDAETADVAIKAAMTGHLVLSTVHTNSAVGAVTRLVDLDVQPFLVGSTLSAAVAQRLVRRLCAGCKRPRSATEQELAMLGRSEATVHDPVGCTACYATGYKGRLAIFELLVIDRALGGRISRGIDETALHEESLRRGTMSLRDDGFTRVLDGTTTIDEVLAATVEA